MSYQVMLCHGRHVRFDQTGNSAIQSVDPENPTLEEPNKKLIRQPVPDILSFEISKMAAGIQFGFGATRNRSNRSSIPENTTVKLT